MPEPCTHHPPATTPHYVSERAWLEHLRLLGGLPYPSWALMPTIMQLARQHVAGAVSVFVWYDQKRLHPVAMWADPVNVEAYCNWVANFTHIIEDALPTSTLVASRGRAVRAAETSPGYEQSGMYTQVFAPQGIYWHMSIPLDLGTHGMGFLGVSRGKAAGPYSDDEWARWDRVGGALCELDRDPHPWAGLPPAPTRECASTTLWLGHDGRFLAQGRAVRDLLFLARQTGMGPPDWVQADWRALPPQVRAVAEDLFRQTCQSHAAPSRAPLPAQRLVSLRFDWGCFDFVLECMPPATAQASPTLSILIRHHEPLDIIVARKLWGWPLSPREKSLLVAATREPSLAQLATALGLTVGTVKYYFSEIKARLGVESRHALIDWVLNAASNPAASIAAPF